MEAPRKSFATVTSEAVTSRISRVKDISTRPSSSLFIHILFLCFTFGLQHFISLWSCQVLKESWCWLRRPNSCALIGVLKFATERCETEALLVLLWPLVLCELFVYSFQRFSGSCALSPNILLQALADFINLLSSVVPERSRKIWTGQSALVHLWPHARHAFVTQRDRANMRRDRKS